MILIKLSNIDKSYRTKKTTKQVLCSWSLEIDQGEFIAVTGRSGTGKTTLLHMLSLLTKPDAGAYYFDGACVSRYTEKQKRAFRFEHIGYAIQGNPMISFYTVLQNVLVASADRAFADQLLDVFQIKDLAASYPHQLSKGQLHRVSLVRALMRKPKLLIADEPTSALDAETASIVMQELCKYHDTGMTIIIATHDLPTLPSCTRRIDLNDPS